MKAANPTKTSFIFNIRYFEILSLIVFPVFLTLLVYWSSGFSLLLILASIFSFILLSLKPKYGFYLLALSIFWGKSFELGSLIITLTDIVLLVMVGFFMARYLLKGKKLKKIAFSKPIMIFFIICCLSVLWADFKLASIKEIIQIIELYILFNLICSNDLDEKIISSVGRIFVIGMTLHSFLVFSDQSYHIGRFYGSMGAMTPYATAFVMLLIFSLWLYEGVLKKFNILLLAAFLVNGMALLLTQVRSAWIALATGLFIISFLKNKKYSLVVVGALFIIVVSLLFLPFTPALVIERIESFVDPKYPFNLTRLVLLQNGFYAFLDSPILGIGIRNLIEVGLKYWENSSKIPPWSVEEIVKLKAGAHNLWLTLLAEVGIVGFIIYSWLIFSGLKLSNLCLKVAKTNYDKSIGSFLVAFFIVFIIISNFTTFQAYTAGTIFLVFFFNVATLLSKRRS